MEYGSLSDYLPEYETNLVSVEGEKRERLVRLTGRTGKRHRSMADTIASLGKIFEDTTDSRLYRPRVDVLKNLRFAATAFTPPHPAPKPSILPSYRHISSRIGSFREAKVCRSRESPEELTNLEIRHELLLKERHKVLRTIRRETKIKGEDRLRPTMAEHFQMRLKNRLRKLARPDDSSPIWRPSDKGMFQKPTILPTPIAVLKTKGISTKLWRTSHGQVESNAESGFTLVCTALFHTLDLEDSGKVSTRKLAWLLLALGVGIESDIVSKAIKGFFRIQQDKCIRVGQWIALLSDKSSLSTVLSRLVPNNSQENTEKQGDFKAETDLNGFVSSLEMEFHHLSQVWEQIKLHWKSIDPLNSEIANIDSAAKRLVALGVTVQERAAVKMLSKLANRAKIVTKTDFFCLFVRPLLKLHIEAFDRGLRCHFGSALTVASISQKITEITRITILSGMDYKPERCRFAGSVVERLQDFDATQLSESYIGSEPRGTLRPYEPRAALRTTQTPSPDLLKDSYFAGDTTDRSLLENSYREGRHSPVSTRYASTQSYDHSPELGHRGKVYRGKMSPSTETGYLSQSMALSVRNEMTGRMSADLTLSRDFQRFVEAPSLPGLGLFLS